MKNTILNGVTITGSIDAKKINGADFTGSKDAIILVEDVEELERLTAHGTILTDAKVIIEYNETMAVIDKAFSKQKTKNRKNG